MQPDFKAGIRTVLNCRGSPWKVLEFSSTLNVVAWKFFWICFGCRWQNINHSSEFLMVTYIKGFLLYAIANYQFKTSELTNVEKVVKQTVQAFKRLRMEWECVFLYSLWNCVPGSWPLKSNMVIKKPFKMVSIFFYEPCQVEFPFTQSFASKAVEPCVWKAHALVELNI